MSVKSNINDKLVFSRSTKLVIIERLLLLAERYVITIEVKSPDHRHTHCGVQKDSAGFFVVLF